jgi:hypothetical protein
MLIFMKKRTQSKSLVGPLASLFVVSAPICFGALLAACASHPPPVTQAPPPMDTSNPAAPPKSPKLLGPGDADAMIEDAWKKNSITPAPTADDAVFFRRVSLDLTGMIPTSKDVTAFLADTSPNKREKAVDSMLASPSYADHMTNVWDRILLGREVKPGVVDRFAFRAWLHEQFEKNVRYDKWVFDLVTSTGQNSVGGRLFQRTDPTVEDVNDPKVNGAVNWVLHFDNLPDIAGTTSRTFLGVQIQCAQCHDHKTEKWKQTDFRDFAAIFNRTKPQLLDNPKAAMGTRKIAVVDVDHPVRGGKMAPPDIALYLQAPPHALDGTDFSNAPNRRVAFAKWLIDPKNPWFAREIVNRTWAQFVGRGFFEPIDDYRESNPPILPELLDKLSADFAASGYDLKHLMKLMALTEAYQRADATSQPGDMDEKLWGHFQLQRLGPDELLDSVARATNLDAVLDKAAGENIGKLRFAMRRQFSFLFDVDEMSDNHDEFDGTISQALLMMNGNLINRGASALPQLAIGEILKADPTDDARVSELTLRTLSRPASADELKKWVAFVQAPRDVVLTDDNNKPVTGPADKKQPGKTGKSNKKNPGGLDPLQGIEKKIEARTDNMHVDSKRQAYEDLMWAQLNSSEFNFNH